MPARRGMRFVVVTVAVCVASDGVAAAQAGDPYDLRWDGAADASITLAAAGAWVASEALKPELAPERCRWCRVDGLDARVREALVWQDTAAAGTASDVAAFVVAPLVAASTDALAAVHDGAARGIPLDLLLVAEATVVAMVLNQATKFLVGRERPFVHALDPREKSNTAHPADNNLSFFSGHTTETFALASSVGTVATMRGYAWAPVTWAVGGAVAVTTGYLRIAADEHWLTDVLTGAVVGTAVGLAVPLAFHGRSEPPVATSMSPLSLPPVGVALPLSW